jgi:hypothetical protein
MQRKIIAVDFDGMLCENQYPDIGKPNTRMINWLIKKKACGSKIILWTCRTGEGLDHAVAWCGKQGLIFDAVNANLPEIIEQFGGDTRKVNADIYIDDHNAPVFSCFKNPIDILSEEV